MHTHAHLPRTIPFRQRQNKLIRSEVRAYQRGISIQIEALSGHKQQEAKQDPGAAEWEDERQGETKKEGECVRHYGGVRGGLIGPCCCSAEANVKVMVVYLCNSHLTTGPLQSPDARGHT